MKNWCPYLIQVKKWLTLHKVSIQAAVTAAQSPSPEEEEEDGAQPAKAWAHAT